MVAELEMFLGLTATGWTGVAAIAAVLTLLVALIAAFLVLRQIREARELSEEQSRPYIVVLLRESEADWSITDFVVKNVGVTAARNLRIEISPPYVRAREDIGYEFMKARFIARPTWVLPPGEELRTYFDHGREIQEAGQDVAQPFVATVRYLDRRGKELKDEFEIDVRQLHDGIVRADVHGLHHIAKTLRALAKNQGVTSF